MADNPCDAFLPDHNGECQTCDEWASEHTPAAIAAGERLMRRAAIATGAPNFPPRGFTPAQLLALRDIVAHYLTLPAHSEMFIYARGGIETTPEQLLQLLMWMTQAGPAPEQLPDRGENSAD